jgi:hypothetical protein
LLAQNPLIYPQSIYSNLQYYWQEELKKKVKVWVASKPENMWCHERSLFLWCSRYLIKWNMPYDKAKHLEEVDEKIHAVFIVNSTDKIQELFIAKDAEIDRSIVESVQSTLDLKLETKTQNLSTRQSYMGYFRVW